jgi:hypothetical protein
MKLARILLAAFLFAATAAAAPPQACDPASPSSDGVSPPTRGDGLGDLAHLDLALEGAVMADIEPAIGVELGLDRREVDLTPATRGLEFAPSSAGYQTYDRRRLVAGVGGELTFHYGNSTFLSPALWSSVGLLPLAGGGAEARRKYPSREALESRPPPPSGPQALLDAIQDLHPGDSLGYDTEGGLVFWAAAGYGAVGSVSVAALARGEFRVTAEKADDRHVRVRLGGTRVRALGLQAGNAIAGVSVTEFRRYARALSFVVDARTAEGQAALHDLVLGNAAPVQKLAAAGSRAVSFVDDDSSTRTGTGLRVTLGVPSVLGLSWERSRFFEARVMRDLPCGRRLEIRYGAFAKGRSAAAFGAREELTRAFYGASYTDSSRATRGRFAELSLAWRAHGVRPGALASASAAFARAMGLPSLALELPGSAPRRLRYAALTVRARLRADQLSRMLRGARSLSPDQPALAGLRAALGTLSGALRAGSEEAVSRAFSRVGGALFSDPAALRAGLALAGDDVPVDFLAEGSDFHRLERRAHLARGALVTDDRPPLAAPSSDALASLHVEFLP